MPTATMPAADDNGRPTPKTSRGKNHPDAHARWLADTSVCTWQLHHISKAYTDVANAVSPIESIKMVCTAQTLTGDRNDHCVSKAHEQTVYRRSPRKLRVTLLSKKETESSKALLHPRKGGIPNSASINGTAIKESRSSSGEGIVLWKKELDQERILADDLGSAAVVVVFAPNRNSNLPHHQKFRASCEETSSPREQADLLRSQTYLRHVTRTAR